MQKIPSVRFYLLDLMRFAAAFAVVLYHFTARSYGESGDPVEAYSSISWITAYGFLGVQLFFVVSGFVILLSAKGRRVGQFVASRVSRLFPAYWAAVALTSILLVWIAPQLGRSLTLPQVLVNLTMLQDPLGVEPVDGVYWTLWVELLFYLWIALLIIVGLSDAKVYWFAFLWPLAGLVAQALDYGTLSSILSAKYAPLFAGGMILFMIYSKGHSLFRWALLSLNVALSVWQTTRYELPGAEAATGLDLSSPLCALVVLIVFAVVAVATTTPMASRGSGWMTYAGRLTYPLYLIHQYWGLWILGIVTPLLGAWIALLAAVFGTLGLAAILERWVERPLRPPMRRGLSRLLAGGGQRV